MNPVLSWWDGVEEWLTGLGQYPQLLVSLVVVLPLAALVAIAINWTVETVADTVDRDEVSDDHGLGV